MYLIGIDPGTVYTPTDYVRGKCPARGTRAVVYDTANQISREFVLCEVAASQNLVKGHVVTFDITYVATVMAAGPALPGAAAVLAVAQATVTASASMFIWACVYGRTQVLASISCNPNVILAAGSVAGQVDDTLTSLSAQIDGIHLVATAATSGLTAAMLNYPRFQSGS